MSTLGSKNLTEKNIDDTVISTDATYSNQKIEDLFVKKTTAEPGVCLTTDATGNLVSITGDSACFTVVDSSQTTLTTTYQTIIYKNVVRNPCNYYNTTTGEFQPKVKGIYYVFASAHALIGNGIWINFLFNGVMNLEFFGTSTTYGCRLMPFNGTTDKIVVQAKVNTAGTHNPWAFRNFFEAYLAFS